MFEKTKDSFYQSLGESIKNRKKALGLIRKKILKDERRVSRIIHGIRNEHYPYLICRSEYPHLNLLFQCESKNDFIFKNDLIIDTKEFVEKCGKINCDEMLWGHINWDKMFQDVITELSELLESSELSELKSSEELVKLFKDTLVDYVPYAGIRYDELPHEYGRIFIPLDEKKEKRKNAIERVHLRHGSELFKQTFLERFSGKKLREFDKEFLDFVSDYLNKRKPNDYSLGLQAYNFHKSISRIAIRWQSLAEVQYVDMPVKKSNFQILLEEYIKYGREQMKELEKYQQKFDAFHVDINDVCVDEEI